MSDVHQNHPQIVSNGIENKISDTKNFIEKCAKIRWSSACNTPIDLLDISICPDGRTAVAAAEFVEDANASPTTRIVLIDLEIGRVERLTSRGKADRAPRWCPTGKRIAFISEGEHPGCSELHVLERDESNHHVVRAPTGWIEYFHWSPCGEKILLGIAGADADLAGAQGGFSVAIQDDALPNWYPRIEKDDQDSAWRSTWHLELTSNTLSRCSPEGSNVWDAIWCGTNSIVAVCSDRPDEAAWYQSDLRIFDISNGAVRILCSPDRQIGWLASSPSGCRVAFVEALSSDRTVVAGDLRIVDVASGVVQELEELNVDVVQCHWRGDDNILFSAYHSPESLIGVVSITGDLRFVWRSCDQTPSGTPYPRIYPIGSSPGDVVFLCEGFNDPPTLVSLRDGQYRVILSFDTGRDVITSLGEAQNVTWIAPDGLEIQGWLLTPQHSGPHPLVLDIHGGPVWCWRPKYLGKSVKHMTLLARGYAILLPNPRGSSGRGDAYARHVFGDMGGADTQDYLSGLEAMIRLGIAEPTKLGVTGGSYGGFMTTWLITQDDRFAAAIPVCPVTDWVSQRFTSHIPHFCDTFLADDPHAPAGRYFSRSPIHFAHRARTPTLSICGAKDRNTPPTQALEFHRALTLNGIESVLLTYPREGHGIRELPALIDSVARQIDWLERFMPPEPVET